MQQVIRKSHSTPSLNTSIRHIPFTVNRECLRFGHNSGHPHSVAVFRPERGPGPTRTGFSPCRLHNASHDPCPKTIYDRMSDDGSWMHLPLGVSLFPGTRTARARHSEPELGHRRLSHTAETCCIATSCANASPLPPPTTNTPLDAPHLTYRTCCVTIGAVTGDHRADPSRWMIGRASRVRNRGYDAQDQDRRDHANHGPGQGRRDGYL